MPIIKKEIIKLPNPDPAGRIQYQIAETVQRVETRIVTKEDVQNLITYHQVKLVELQKEVTELEDTK